ncbi:Hsp20/alpha crystallin family protein [Candidatus Mcinerneyibacteriota bacterium]|nr:Hsp20/alpha crystallin family protein [Candidatus Mcinerneyibacteriota bacterium]
MKPVKRSDEKRMDVARRYDPFRDFFDEFESMFEDFFRPGLVSRTEDSPALIHADIGEDDEKYMVRAALPGMDEKNIKVSVEDGVLSIQAERKEEESEEKKGYFRREIGYGRYERRFRLPDNVNLDKVDARYKNGILDIDLPKKEKGMSKKEIKVKGA